MVSPQSLTDDPSRANRRVVRLTSSARRLSREHGRRFAVFAAIGLSVFLLGLGLQFALVQYAGMDHVVSYLIQGVVSIQISFVLNLKLTWRDRDTKFWIALGRFNLQKLLASVLNVAAYIGFVAIGIEYLLANVVTTAVFTIANYLLGHYWSFLPSKREAGAK
ncbi:MAG TPA: GtrA family protein [Acidimicrobiales bacterium]|nr:GtrA family protein [Acidimicrobiales bacterium]